MKYIIMCGGDYEFSKPLTKINNETLVERTARLLKENGITDIAISTNNPEYQNLGIPILHHQNKYNHNNYEQECTNSDYIWLNSYYPTKEECCYLHGDVYFSEAAIKKIIETPVEDTLFICTFDETDGERNKYNRKGREPFGYKVKNQEAFQYAIKKIKQMVDRGKFKGHITPIAWHVYRFLNGLDVKPEATEYTQINNIFQDDGDYIIINDETVDIDTQNDIDRLEETLKEIGEEKWKS